MAACDVTRGPCACGAWHKPNDPVSIAHQEVAQQIAANFDANALKMIEAAARKAQPLARGCLDYFPDALLAVAQLSLIGNEQHNPGQPLHWDKSKSTDEADALLRHLIDRGTLDTDGVRHSAKIAWRALALLQKELETADGEG